mmetsp:Transcript_75715/g.202549  ORF Transcript_75715/g.202549 Transcript_75715/m.202549 type:complete len:250 (+) Transcript_75715:919-1668(+)
MPARFQEHALLGVRGHRLVPTQPPEAGVELVWVVDEVPDGDEIKVGNDLGANPLAAEELLIQSCRRRNAASDVPPERPHVPRTREAPSHADHRHRCAAPRCSAAPAPTHRACGRSPHAEVPEQRAQGTVLVQVQHGDGDAEILGEGGHQLGCQEGMPTQVEERCLVVELRRVQVQQLGPDPCNNPLQPRFTRRLSTSLALLRLRAGEVFCCQQWQGSAVQLLGLPLAQARLLGQGQEMGRARPARQELW